MGDHIEMFLISNFFVLDSFLTSVLLRLVLVYAFEQYRGYRQKCEFCGFLSQTAQSFVSWWRKHGFVNEWTVNQTLNFFLSCSVPVTPFWAEHCHSVSAIQLSYAPCAHGGHYLPYCEDNPPCSFCAQAERCLNMDETSPRLFLPR